VRKIQVPQTPCTIKKQKSFVQVFINNCFDHIQRKYKCMQHVNIIIPILEIFFCVGMGMGKGGQL
jgi:hypothetical protein